MRNLLLVGAGGALGAMARYGVGLAFARRSGVAFPYGTLFINLSGSFLITLFLGRAGLSDTVRLLIPVGFVGAYTTFSTYELELLRLWETGRLGAAALYLAASNVLGFVAVALGDLAGRRSG